MVTEGTLPNYKTVRKLITQIPERSFRLGVMYGYLIAGRVSEIVTKICPSDTGTTPNGPYGRDYDLAKYNDHDVLILNVKTSKREGLPRDIGIPLDKNLEPFAEKVLDYFQEHQADDPVFYYTRQDLYNASIDTFKGYIYPIEPYTVREIDQEKYQALIDKVPDELKPLIKPPSSIIKETRVPRHTRRLALHGSMRHYRMMELTRRCGFNKEERDIYSGHVTGGVDDRYTHLNWRQYFPKLTQ